MIRRLTIATLTVALSLIAAAPAAGQPLTGSMFEGDEEERAALANADDNKYIRAREQAEKILLRQPDSFLATWVLEQCFHYEEANLPRSLFLVRKAAKLMQQRYGPTPANPEAQRWHRKLLEEEGFILGEMDRALEVLALLDCHDALYRPHLRARRMWPLMKLERFDEARALGRELIQSDDLWERGSGFNGLIAVEGEANDRQAAYDWGIRGIAATNQRICVLAHNTAHSALALFRYGEAEGLVKTALKAGIANCSRSPYSRLVPLMLLQGELQKALSAYRNLRMARPQKMYRVQFEMADRGLLAEILYVVGRFEQAEAFLRGIYEAPDRTGMTSASAAEIKLVDSLVYAMILDARLEQEEERSSVRGMSGALDRFQTRRDISLRRWEAARTALLHAATGDELAQLMRPYNKDLRPWNGGHVATVLGAGVTTKAIEVARKLDHRHPETNAFLDAYLGEIAWRDSDLKEARELGEAALATLPGAEVLLRARISAWLGDAEHRQGEIESARRRWHAVLSKVPTVFRHLGLSLPVTITSDGDELSDAVLERLRDSRRLAPGGLFRVDVYREKSKEREQGKGPVDDLKMCLADERGFQFGCTSLQPAGDLDEAVLAACDAFHDKVMAPRIELTQADINSLDGSPTRASVDEALEGMLGREAIPPKP